MLPGYGRWGGNLGVSSDPGTWAPDQISNATVWLDAGHHVVLSGSNVTSWASRIGTYAATPPGTSPTFSATGINSLPTITCGTTSAVGGSYTETGTGLSAFIIGNMSSGSSAFGRLISMANNGGPSSDWNQVAHCQFGRDNVSSDIGCSRGGMGAISTAAIGYNTTFMAGLRFDGTDGRFRVNGSAIGTAASTGSFNINRLNLFANVFGGDAGAGAVCEVIVTTGDISTSDAEKLEGYWAHRYGCTSVLPGGHPYKATPP